jgi:hypothetical protein
VIAEVLVHRRPLSAESTACVRTGQGEVIRLADLEHRTAGGSFLGCYVTYHPNPWVYDYQTFFVDQDTGTSVSLTLHYVK